MAADRVHQRGAASRPLTLALLLVVALALAACSSQSEAHISIVDVDEPGPRLTVEGRVVDATTGEPVAGARIVVYQTDQTGTYQPADPNDESTARIRGEVTTDSDGAFGFDTVQPGEYPDQPVGNRHIHFHRRRCRGLFTARGSCCSSTTTSVPKCGSGQSPQGSASWCPVSGDTDTGLTTSVEIELEPAG